MGIGRAVCHAVAEAGAEVIVAARGLDAVRSTVAELSGGPHKGLMLDVALEDSWVEAMREIDAPLDGLVTAAGVLGPIGPLPVVTLADFRRTVEINLIGTMLALQHFLTHASGPGASAVTFSGGGSTAPLPRYDAYAASKAGVVRLTENVALVAREQGIRVNSIAPGFVATRMHEATLAAGSELAGTEYHERTLLQLQQGGASPREAAELACFLLHPDADGITGKLISAAWDPWHEESYRARLRQEPDLATLRRIDTQLFDRVAQ